MSHFFIDTLYTSCHTHTSHFFIDTLYTSHHTHTYYYYYYYYMIYIAPISRIESEALASLGGEHD